MAATDIMLIQNKRNKRIEEYVTVEQWERDFIPNKLDTKFNIINRNVKDIPRNTSTVEVTEFIKMAKERIKKPPTAITDEPPEAKEVIPEQPEKPKTKLKKQV